MLKKLKIAKVLCENNIFLAPMAGITDASFRYLCKTMGAGLTFTEMISAKGLYRQNKNTQTLLEKFDGENPSAVQIFGRSADIMSEISMQLDFDIIDLNFGCPAPKIVRNFEGSALLKEPKLIYDIINAVVLKSKKAVTVKIRKGFDNSSINAIEVARIAEAAGASLLTIHGRSRTEFYSGEADMEIIQKVKKAVSIPVIANGDIDSPEKAKKVFFETDCDGIMIGRASLGNPWIFRETLAFLNNETIKKPSVEEKMRLALLHAELLCKRKPVEIAVLEMRKHFAYYTKGLENSTFLRQEIMQAKTMQDLYDLAEKIMNYDFAKSVKHSSSFLDSNILIP